MLAAAVHRAVAVLGDTVNFAMKELCGNTLLQLDMGAVQFSVSSACRLPARRCSN